jgi:ABC-type nitrate/sulfonate/bicarbonate transport system substrate-binding protein
MFSLAHALAAASIEKKESMKRLLIGLVAVVMLAAGCGDSSSKTSASASTEQKQHVKVMLDWTPNTNHNGIYLAKERGYYDKAGLDVEIVQPGEQGGLAALGSGSVDFAVSVQESLIPARTEGVPVVSIASLVSTNTSSLMSLSSSGITRPKDLEGKTYGGFGGELEKQLVSSLVKCDGGDPNKIKWADVGNADYRAGLEQHQYDFVWVFEGWDVIHLRQEGVQLNTIPFAQHLDCIPDWYTPLLATSEKMISQNPNTVKAFMEATAHGYNDAIKDPTAASDALLKGAPELDAKLVRESSTYLAKYYAASGQPWGQQRPEIWNGFNDYLHKNGIVTKDLDVNAAYTNNFLPKA